MLVFQHTGHYVAAGGFLLALACWLSLVLVEPICLCSAILLGLVKVWNNERHTPVGWISGTWAGWTVV